MPSHRTFDLTISLQGRSEVMIHINHAQKVNPLPWTISVDWAAMFTCLNMLPGNPPPSGDILAAGIAKKWFTSRGSFKKDAAERVGKELFNTALAGPPGEELSRLIAKYRNDKPLINLILSEADGYVHAYPWELLHDKDSFLFGSNETQLVRCVDVERAPNKFKPLHKLSILLVDPRPILPRGYPELPPLERKIFDDLSKTHADDMDVVMLDPAKGKNTRQKILKSLNFTKGTQIVHIDTHGGYGWLCNCGELNIETTEACNLCSNSKDADNIIQGYLAFEDKTGKTDWISGKELAEILASWGVAIVVLSACKSGLVGGGNSFNSVAGALVHFGIPAAIAMQYSVQADAAADFAEAFYVDLLESKRPWIDALFFARTMLRACKEDHWYRPVLYWNPRAGKLESLYFTRAIPRSSEMKQVDTWSTNIRDQQPARRILRLTAPDGLGKSTFLMDILAKYQGNAFIFSLPANEYFRNDDFSLVFPKIVREFQQAVQLMYPDCPTLAKKTPPETLFTKLAGFLSERAGLVLFLIDDFDFIPLPDRQLFNQYVVEPLLSFRNIGIIQTTTFLPTQEEDTYLLNQQTDKLELTPPQEADIAKALGEVEASYADEIFNWTGGNPRAAYRIIRDFDLTGKAPQKKELLRSLYADDEKLKELLGQDKTSRNIVSILSVLRQFDNQVAGKLVPAAMNNIMGEDYPAVLSALQVVGLVQSLGSRVSWLDGKYCIHGSIAINHLNYLRYVEPHRFKALHMAALECYQALLTKLENQQPRRILDYLIEVFYHSQVLIELRTGYKKSQRAKLMEGALAAYWRTIPFGVNKLIVLAEIQQKLSVDSNLGWLAKSEILQRLFRSNIA